MYLTAIIDWYSRYIISWELDQTGNKLCFRRCSTCVYLGKPEIFNSDQGSHFTSPKYINLLKEQPSIQISVDSRGRALDNI
ncbi:DDE-type integrase/transposase/recombinase [Lentibacillus populi]|uniref:DDE-type integrase/transposase/recombinase n=1 Tax=Lentibacillus populi TaxID=1827502 RepID=UPI0035313708